MNLHPGGRRGTAAPRSGAGADAAAPAAPPSPQAGFFGPAAAPLFGWLHPAPVRPAPAALGLVICAPLGHEMTNAHRSLRALAIASAAAGVPALRFDYAGCGDSADPAPAGDTLAAWLASVGQAIEHLRRCSGVPQVALLGLRSGALLALAAAAARATAGDVPAVVALAPVVSGQRLLREWRALHSTAALRSTRADGALEVAGHCFDAATCAALAALTLATPPAVRHALVLDRDDLPGADRWVAALRSGGASVRHARLPGFAAMLDEPQRHVVPQQVLQQTTGWLREQAAAAAAGGPAAPAAAAHGWPGHAQPAAVSPAVQEQPLQLRDASGGELFGIVSQAADDRCGIVSPAADDRRGVASPAAEDLSGIDSLVAEERRGIASLAADDRRGIASLAAADRSAIASPASDDPCSIASPAADAGTAAPPRRTLLLVNTGPVHHVGGNRLYVLLARRLAVRGHRVLRLDLSGIGDSPARPGEADNVVYGTRASEDIALALAGLQAAPGVPAAVPLPVELLGLCSGGYHALKYALAHDGVARAFVVNPLVFYWKPGMSLEAGEVDVQAAIYRNKWRDPRRWWRLLTGRSDLRLLAQVGGQRARARLGGLGGWLLGWLRRGGMALAPDDLARDLVTVARRGTHLHFVFSQGDPGLALLHAEAGGGAARLQQAGALSIHTLAAADHTLTTEDARERFMAHVEQALESQR